MITLSAGRGAAATGGGAGGPAAGGAGGGGGGHGGGCGRHGRGRGRGRGGRGRWRGRRRGTRRASEEPGGDQERQAGRPNGHSKLRVGGYWRRPIFLSMGMTSSSIWCRPRIESKKQVRMLSRPVS